LESFTATFIIELGYNGYYRDYSREYRNLIMKFRICN